jgi:hypothetical protein
MISRAPAISGTPPPASTTWSDPAATMSGAEVAVPGDLAASVASPSLDCAAPATNAKLI